MSSTGFCLRGSIAVAAVALFAGTAHAQATIFDFAGNLTGSGGPATMSFFNGTTTSNAVSFGTASGFGLPALSGGNATVLKVPAFSGNQGLALLPNSGPNGGSSFYINQYTMGFDVLITDPDAWFSFFQTNDTNSNDGDFFKRPNNSGNGIGISGIYDGVMNTNTWYRVMVTVDTSDGASPTMNKYINGVLVGTQVLGEGLDGRWSMYSTVDPTLATFLLTDNDGDTSPGYINSYYFNPTVLNSTAIASFGSATAQGFVIGSADVAPEPGTLALLLTGLALPLLRRRK